MLLSMNSRTPSDCKTHMPITITTVISHTVGATASSNMSAEESNYIQADPSAKRSMEAQNVAYADLYSF